MEKWESDKMGLETFSVSQDTNNAANTSHSVDFFMPGQQMATGAFRRGFKAFVNVLHQDIQLFTIQNIDCFFHL